jgi:hypothetical protein
VGVVTRRGVCALRVVILSQGSSKRLLVVNSAFLDGAAPHPPQIRLLGIPLQAARANFLWQERRRLDCFPELLVFTWRMLDTNERFLVRPGAMLYPSALHSGSFLKLHLPSH